MPKKDVIEPAEPAVAEQPAPAEPATGVRLLVDCAHGPSGAFALLPADIAANLVATGAADDHPDAVAYAQQQLGE